LYPCAIATLLSLLLNNGIADNITNELAKNPKVNIDLCISSLNS
jgi:hypothetical protein